MISLWISYHFLFATISCVHPSLWIDVIMIFIYLESYTLERSCISIWYPLLSRPPFRSCFISLVAPWRCVSWVRILYRCILMHSFVVKIIFFSCLSWRGFCHFYWYPSSWKSYPFYIFTTGCHKHRLFIWLVVSLWTHLLLCVVMIGLALCISFIQEDIDA